MKKIIAKSAILLLINIMIIGVFLITNIPKYTTALILFLPIVIDVVISEKLFRRMANKQKCYIYVVLSLTSLCVFSLFSVYQYYFWVMDIVGVLMVLMYTLFFNVIPFFVIAFIYLINYKRAEEHL